MPRSGGFHRFMLVVLWSMLVAKIGYLVSDYLLIRGADAESVEIGADVYLALAVSSLAAILILGVIAARQSSTTPWIYLVCAVSVVSGLADVYILAHETFRDHHSVKMVFSSCFGIVTLAGIVTAFFAAFFRRHDVTAI
ncbi:hypothetical protein [Salininema proteolyticum]|uniref:Uncharacterized protein n=1 Tax=Salininema proteolyticum TaxID=1607685 RepID=A0ABV8U1V8_9ACTN